MTKEPTPFGKLLRDARIEVGHTSLTDAAARVGIAVPNLWALEQRAKVPSYETVRKLIVELRLPLERFFPGELILEAAKRVRKSSGKSVK